MNAIENVNNRKMVLIGRCVSASIVSVESALTRIVDGMVYADTKQTEDMRAFHDHIRVGLDTLKKNFSREIQVAERADENNEFYGDSYR